MELTIRPRRLRSSDSLRHMVRETRMSPDSLIYPIFVDETLSGRRPIPSLEGQYHYGLDCVCDAVRECLEAGVGRCILFGLPARKDALGSSAWDGQGVVQQAIRAIKAAYPDFYVITDVCMCEYTDHGHCGALCGHEVDNDSILEVLLFDPANGVIEQRQLRRIILRYQVYRPKLFSKECAAYSASPAMLQGKSTVWDILEFLCNNFGFFFFHGVPFCVSTCDGQAIFTSHSIMWWKFRACSVSAAL